MNINKSFIFLIILSFLFISCQKSDYKEVNKYTIEQFMNTTWIGGSSFSSDESKILYTSDASGIFNAYTIPISGGEAKQITHSDTSSIFAISFFPNDDRMLFRADKNGNEIYHLYLFIKRGCNN